MSEGIKHYFGAPAILERLGYSKRTLLPALIKRWGFPAYKRRHSGTLRPMWYANEAMVLSWELNHASIQREQLVADLSAGVDRRYKAGERKRKNSPHVLKSESIHNHSYQT